MHVYMACMPVYMACMHMCTYAFIVYMRACMYVCMYVCMYACIMYVCMYVCIVVCREVCERLGVVPVSYFTRHISDQQMTMRYHGLGPVGTKAIAKVLRVGDDGVSGSPVDT